MRIAKLIYFETNVFLMILSCVWAN